MTCGNTLVFWLFHRVLTGWNSLEVVRLNFYLMASYLVVLSWRTEFLELLLKQQCVQLRI